jgi:hypothetical protein
VLIRFLAASPCQLGGAGHFKFADTLHGCCFQLRWRPGCKDNGGRDLCPARAAVINAQIRRSLPYKGTRYIACCSLCTRKIPDLPTAVSFLSQRHLPDWRLLLRVPYCFFLIPFALLLGLSTWGKHADAGQDDIKDGAEHCGGDSESESCNTCKSNEHSCCSDRMCVDSDSGSGSGLSKCRRCMYQSPDTCNAPGNMNWTEVEYASDGMVSLRCQQAPIGEVTRASFATCEALGEAPCDDVVQGAWTNVCVGFFDHVQIMQDGIKQRHVFANIARFLVQCDKEKRPRA